MPHDQESALAVEMAPNLASQLLKALGLADLQRVVDVKLELHAMDAARLTVQLLVSPEQGKALSEMLEERRYELTLLDVARSPLSLG